MFPSFKLAFRFWLKLGFISFGGPAGQIAIMHQYIVEQQKWISESRFLHALNYCMLLPGPEAQQLAIYIGWLLHGNRGGLVAGVLFVLPSVFILLGLSIAYVLFGHLPAVGAIFVGLKPAILALVALAFFKISKKTLHQPLHFFVAVVSFVLIWFYKVPFPFIILGAIIIGIIYGKSNRKSFKESSALNQQEELNFFLNSVDHRPIPTSKNRNIKLIGIGLICWIAPLFFLTMYSNDAGFWINLILFFTKAALVTFGGAYAVLPYVAQVSVDKFSWLGKSQMIDGLALGETTPGPLIMILAYVGFMAGYNLHDHSLVQGTLALLVTTWYTFLPGFLFILIGAPYVEKSKNHPWINQSLTVVSAAVAGVILNLMFFFAQSTLVDKAHLNAFAIGWMMISLIAIMKFKVKMMVWLAISACAGISTLFFL